MNKDPTINISFDPAHSRVNLVEKSELRRYLEVESRTSWFINKGKIREELMSSIISDFKN